MRFEKTRRQQERAALDKRRTFGQPFLRPGDDIFTVGVGHVELVEAEPRRKGRLMLHPEQRRVPTSVRQNLR
jgi:hypothetical protein